MFLHLPFAIWLSLVLVGSAVSGGCFSLLWACKPGSAPVDDKLYPGAECCGAAQILHADGGWTDSLPAALLLLVPAVWLFLPAQSQE